MCGATPCGPAGTIHLGRTTDGQRIGRYILRYRGAGRNQRAASHRDRGNQQGVAADEDVILDHRLLFANPVVIARDGSGADIDPSTDSRIAEIAQMVRLRTFTQLRLLHLHKVAHLGVLPHHGSGTEVCEGTDDRAFFKLGFSKHATVANQDPIVEHAVRQANMRVDDAILADAGRSFQRDMGVNDRIRPDRHIGVDPGTHRIMKGHARFEPLQVDLAPRYLLGHRQLPAGIDPQPLIGIPKGQGRDTKPALLGHADQIGEVIFGPRIFPLQLVQRFKQEPGVHHIGPHVDLAELRFRRGGISILNDPHHRAFPLGLSFPTDRVAPHHSAVSGGIIEEGRQDAHRGSLRLMEVPESAERSLSEQGCIAVQDQVGRGRLSPVAHEGVPGLHHGVARPELLGLLRDRDGLGPLLLGT